MVYVRVAFRDGAPEVSGRNRAFAARVGATGFGEGDAATQIHPQIAPQPADVIVTKKRVSAFCGSDLDVVLRAKQVTHLVLAGIALLINSWNELIAQPQPNPYPASMGDLRHSMGAYDASGTALWVDPYGAEYVRDLEPTKEYGRSYDELLHSCVHVYRLGGCGAAGAPGERCCDLTEDFRLIRSLRENDPQNELTTQHVLTTASGERDVLVASGAWEEGLVLILIMSQQ